MIAPAPRSQFRLSQNVKPVGSFSGGHRSGWPYVVAALQARQSASGMLLDEFVERTFYPRSKSPSLVKRVLHRAPMPPVWKEPWVGIFHLPPNFPDWFAASSHPRDVIAGPRFRKSRPYLRGAVALSTYSAAWLERELGVPVLVAKHPTEFPDAKFSWEAFCQNPQKKMVQVGWYLRNYRAIYQVPAPSDFQKVHIAQDKPFILKAQRRTDQYSPFRNRPDVGEVSVVTWLENAAYDRLLTENVVFIELFDASANNAVIEAIARETPIVVNRHPAVIEYLGADYPLFYDDIGEVPRLLAMPRIKAAHDHIRAMDKSALKIDSFVTTLDRFIGDVR